MPGPRVAIFATAYRTFSIGVFLTVSIAAFENYAIASIAPTIASDLNASRQFTWIFTAMLISQIAGTAIFARIESRLGPLVSLVAGIIVVAIGLAGAIIASNMLVLVAARVTQGVGTGALINIIYSSIGYVLPQRLHSAAFTLISVAYVVPAAAGPFITGAIARAITWRGVFGVVLPLMVLSPMLLIPALRRAKYVQSMSHSQRIASSVFLAFGTAVISGALAVRSVAVAAFLAAAGLSMVLVASRRAFPRGFLVGRPVLPAALSTRGFMTALFLGSETFIISALSTRWHLSVTLIALAISVSAITWALGSLIQTRLDAQRPVSQRSSRLLTGVIVMLSAEMFMLLVPFAPSAHLAFTVSVVGHTIAGLGMGFVEPLTGTIVLSVQDESLSFVAAGMQLADLVPPAVSIALGGHILNLNGYISTGFASAFGVQLLFGLVGLVAAIRLAYSQKGNR